MPRLREALRPYLIFVLAAILAIACSGGGSSNGSGANNAGADTKGPRFLMTTPKGLVERAGGADKVLIPSLNGAFVINPTVSPDGKKIAYALQLPAKAGPDGKVDFGVDLYVSDRDGGNPKLIVKHTTAGETIARPNWLPDGKRLIYEYLGLDAKGDSDMRIEMIDLDSGKRTRVIEDAIEPGVAADGKTIAYVYVDPQIRIETLMVGDLTTGASRKLSIPGCLTFFESLEWSPDGSRLAFGAANPGCVTLPAANPGPTSAHPTLQDIWVIKADGTEARLVSELGDSLPSISWAPDGAHMYVLGALGFWLIDAANGSKQSVGDGIAQGEVQLLR